MSIPLVINGVTYNYPQPLDTNWGPVLDNWSTAVTNGMLQTGGSNGATFVKSATANPAQSGVFRLSNNEGVTWRNFLNNADLTLKVDASNNLLFNGVAVGNPTTLTNTHILVGNVSNVPTDVAMSGDVHISNTGATTIQAAAVTGSKIAATTITDSNMASGTLTDASINASAAITLSKLAVLTANKALESDAFGVIAVSSVTNTELGFVSGASSNLQAQINAITGAGQFTSGMMMVYAGSAAPSGWLMCNGNAVSRTTYAALFAIIGTTYGVGDGSTTFNLPNMVNTIPVGQGGSIVASLGATAGSTTVTPTDSGHVHPIPHRHTTPWGASSSTTFYGASDSGGTIWPEGTTNENVDFGSWAVTGGGPSSLPYFKTTTTDTANSSSGAANIAAVSVVQPSLGVNYIIKT